MVSVIVPVYNSEKYLDDCIRSVQMQNYKEWELLLVDDGSTDSSAEICRKYAGADMRIIYIRNEHAGVSVSRNVGLESATGKYVIFLDADDFWRSRTDLEHLVCIAEENNVDVVRGDFVYVDENGGTQISYPELHNMDGGSQVEIYDSCQFLEKVIKDKFFCVLCLFKRASIQDVRFEACRVFMEDMVFLAKVLIRPLRCIYVSTLKFYAYRKYGFNATVRKNILKLRDTLHNSLVFKELYDKAGTLEMKNYCIAHCLDLYCISLKWLARDSYYNEHRQFIESYQVENIRREIGDWIKRESIHVPIHNYILKMNPYFALNIYRWMYKCSLVIHWFK